MKPFTPKRVETKVARGARVKGAFPRYVSLGNAKRVACREVLIAGRVYADYDKDGELIGVEIVG